MSNKDATVSVPSSSINLGGFPTESDDPDLVFASQDEKPPSVKSLLDELEASLIDLVLVEKKLKDAAWNSKFQNLMPDEVAKIVKQVDYDFDQPTVCRKISPKRWTTSPVSHADGRASHQVLEPGDHG